MVLIERPTLLLDKEKCVKNITRMVARANQNKVRLRPHFKTHQSREIAQWFRGLGVTACTVSSLQMAEYFAADGWDDITVAFPINYLESELINTLAAQIKLNLCVSVPGVLPLLQDRLRHAVHLYIEIDTGYHRTGINATDEKTLSTLFHELQGSSYFHFEGFLSHAGNSYASKTKKQIEHVHEVEMKQMRELREKYKSQFPGIQLSVGDTPTASVCDDFREMDEMRPGNFVFYDLAQFHIGSCRLDQIAVVMACPVVASYPDRHEIIVYGGGVHFSKDFILAENGKPMYGYVVRLKENGWELPPTAMRIQSLSQEHGVIYAPDGEAMTMKPGEKLGILPIHACLTADAMGSYVTLDGKVIKRFN